MNYPDGRRRSIKAVNQTKNSIQRKQNFANRGMTLEEDLNDTNAFYLANQRAVIHKKPTPIQIVKVNYPKRSAAVITEAYFREASTTDYNGLYKGNYIDFEAKETNQKTSFPLANIHEHQINHMQSIIEHKGISFLIIRFKVLNETYFVPAKLVILFWNEMQAGGRKSIPYDIIKTKGQLIPLRYQPRVDYLSIVDDLYF